MILDYRKENPPQDLFGKRDDEESTVAATTIDDKHIFGVNAKHRAYTDADRAAVKRTRAILIRTYPNVMKSENTGQIPNNALFHAEATVLLRAANANRGTLAGKTLYVVSDRAMCESCKKVLPLLGLEIGNPTVIFTDPAGAVHEMRNGVLKKRSAP